MTVSAGILLYRRDRGRGVEVLLAHPGGPFFTEKDDGHWSIPKGEVPAGTTTHEALACEARREFEEETGQRLTAAAIPIGSVRQRGGKVVHAFACEGDMDPAELRSNTFLLEWPRGSGRTREWPEVDAVGWFPLPEARRKILPAQLPFLERLVTLLGETAT